VLEEIYETCPTPRGDDVVGAEKTAYMLPELKASTYMMRSAKKKLGTEKPINARTVKT
jgi:hypothetical protein